MLFINKNITFAVLIAWLILIFLFIMIVNTLIHKRIEPLRLDTYTKEGEFVFVSKLHTEEERKDNIRLAQFLADKTGEVVYVLPIIQPTQKNAKKLRKEFFPDGVKENKNPDFYFRGRFVDGKSMNDTKPENRKTAKRAIQNRLRNAFLQGNDAFLEIPNTFPLGWIKGAIKGKLKSSKNVHIVYVKYGDELLVFGE